MPPSKAGRCCQSVPRCNSCPVWRAADVLAIRELTRNLPDAPAHLDGVPRCLHKYEPLLLDAWRRGQPGDASEGEHPGEAVA